MWKTWCITEVPPTMSSTTEPTGTVATGESRPAKGLEVPSASSSKLMCASLMLCEALGLAAERSAK